MSDATETETNEQTKFLSPEERELNRILAKSIWKVQKRGSLPAGTTQQTAWAEERGPMFTQARKIVRLLGQSGVTLVRTEPDTSEAKK